MTVRHQDLCEGVGRRWRRTLWLAAIIVAVIHISVVAQNTGEEIADVEPLEVIAPPVDEVPVDGVEIVEAPMEEAAPGDPGAQAFLMKCVGCHTIGGGALSGPDLKPVSAWPRNNLADAIKRMEKNVGPLEVEEVDRYTDFLLSPEAAARLQEEQQRVALQQTAALDPASADAGETYFKGSRAFVNGGLACASCHQAGGKGGNLAASLEDAFTRIGETPLISTCENPGYPIMRAIYANHPITKQEAIHVVKYLEKVSADPQDQRHVPMHEVGMVATIGALIAIGGLHKKRLRGTRARLVAEAHRSQNRGAASRSAD